MRAQVARGWQGEPPERVAWCAVWAWLGVAAWCAGVGGLETSAWGQGARTVPAQTKLASLGLTRMWVGQAVLNVHRDRLHYLTLGDREVFVQATGGVITCFDAESGKRLWASQVGRPDEAAFPAVNNEDSLLVIAGLTLYSVDKRNGDILWRLTLPRIPSTAPAVDSKNIYIGFIDGSVNAFDLSIIKTNFLEGRLPQWSHETVRWRYRTSKTIPVPPLATPNTLFFASLNGSFYGLGPNTRDLQFELQSASPPNVPLASNKELVFVGTADLRIYALGVRDGKIRWQSVFGLPIMGEPIVVENDLYISVERRGLYRLDAATGRETCHYGGASGFLAVSPTRIYCSDLRQNLLILSRESDKLYGSIPLPGFSLRLANDQTDRIYVATNDGVVMGLRELDRPQPTHFKFPERQPLLPVFAPEESAAPGEAAPPAENAPESAPPSSPDKASNN